MRCNNASGAVVWPMFIWPATSCSIVLSPSKFFSPSSPPIPHLLKGFDAKHNPLETSIIQTSSASTTGVEVTTHISWLWNMSRVAHWPKPSPTWVKSMPRKPPKLVLKWRPPCLSPTAIMSSTVISSPATFSLVQMGN